MSKDPASPNNPTAGTVEELLEEARTARENAKKKDSGRLSGFLDLDSLKRQDYESIAWRKKESIFFRISSRSIRASRILSVPTSVPWLLIFSDISEWKDSFSGILFLCLLAHLWFPNWFPKNIRHFLIEMLTRRLNREPLPPHVYLVIGWLIFLVPSGVLAFEGLVA